MKLLGFFHFKKPKLSEGGLIQGASHSEGGVEAVVVESNTPIEVEGEEVIINKKAVKKKGKKHRYGTNKEILHDINTETGGAAILEKGGKVKGKKWIQKAHLKKGKLRKLAKEEGAITEKGTINKKWLDKKSHQKGKVGKEARLAKTLSKLSKHKKHK